MKNLLLLIAFCSSILATAQFQITYNLEKGKTYPQNQVVTSEQSQVINGAPQDVTTIVATNSDYKVIDIVEGVYHIEIMVNSMSNTTKTPMGEQVMDSEGAASNPMNKLFSNMIKDPIKITMNNKGEILTFDNSAQLENMTEGIDMPELQLAQIEAAMKESMNPENQIVNYNLLTKILPDNAVKLGDIWESEATINSVVKFDTNTTYELDSVTDDYYIITAQANIQSPEDSEMDMMGLKAKVDLAGPLAATYTLDRKTGWIKKGKIEQELDGSMTIEKSEMMPQEMKITMETKTTTVIE
ncbi:hypothetical protein LX97_01557 [Nonlabens dokdonensis]|uniref:Cardiolipin synthetase n=2 Tax=Nonlabens dokdonensis TaxID=328515 RepID=L7W6E2_NONDD|nr:DUF6263 family protein [Nonlabens dokdonensis]AGC77250.1 cardiolipin synthetase [Nonlabens dokdonensis DSW-6]PZX40785.1 hypothetical protein LX97_01557 [Nonlabens dokdonensis]